MQQYVEIVSADYKVFEEKLGSQSLAIRFSDILKHELNFSVENLFSKTCLFLASNAHIYIFIYMYKKMGKYM